ncbi:MAG: substrate-binding domain-containing protein [Gammaproteobacteria bacterium]|nr:substrate-binding domain-containing protein [Gammaproteobacteria bacterium]
MKSTLVAALLGMSLMHSAIAGESIQVSGSSTLKPALQAWAAVYAKQNPQVALSVSGDGSGSGFRAMSLGQADLVASSRPISPVEVETLKGIAVELEARVVGLDALSVFVHPDNPLAGMSVAELREIFGEGGRIKKWDELKLRVPGCASGRIELIGRPDGSGTQGDFASLLKAPHGLKLARAKKSAKDVVEAIAGQPCAIGYGAYLKSDRVKALCLAEDKGGACTTPEQALASRTGYPFLRELYLYVPRKAGARVAEFLAWSRGREAACVMQEKTTLIPAEPVSCS